MPCGLVGRYRRFETVCFSEMIMSTYKPTRRYYSEDQYRQSRKKSGDNGVTCAAFSSNVKDGRQHNMYMASLKAVLR
jgi:hypothetical protein